MITVHNVAKAYGSKQVLTAVDARFPEGKLTSLIGPNGAGKSTLLMLMARLLTPSAGEIRIGGMDIADIPIGEFAKQVATLRQSPDLNLRLTVEELVAFGRFPHSRGALSATDRRAVEDALAFLSLGPIRGSYIDELSGGQRQLAFLAMAIAQETSCLLLDEPLNNLDMKNAVEIMRALRRLCDEKGRTLVVVIHDINFAANYSDRIIAMKDGAVRYDGAVGDVVTESCLGDLYGLDFEIIRSGRGRVCNYFTTSGETR